MKKEIIGRSPELTIKFLDFDSMAEGKKDKVTVLHDDGWCLNKEFYLYLENGDGKMIKHGFVKDIDFFGNAKDSGKVVQIVLFSKGGKYAVNLLRWKTAGVKHKFGVWDELLKSLSKKKKPDFGDIRGIHIVLCL